MSTNRARPTLAEVTIGVMGSGKDGHHQLAKEVGELLALLSVNLLTGGGKGVMESASQAFVQSPNRQLGICIGILPSASVEDPTHPKRYYPNPFVELPIYTHLPLSGDQGQDLLSRNHINILSCAAIIALPGGPGTASEVSLALRYGKPILVYSPDPSLISDFPPNAPFASHIEEVRAFLEGVLAR